jgi:hypothetical protein
MLLIYFLRRENQMGWRTKEEAREYLRKYREKNRETLLAKQKAYYETHKDHVKEWGKQYRREHQKEIYERNRAYQQAHREKVIEWVKAYKIRNPEKAKAQMMAKKIPMRRRCEACKGRATDRHHEDYKKPLEVIFLCRRCHKMLHKEVTCSLGAASRST